MSAEHNGAIDVGVGIAAANLLVPGAVDAHEQHGG